MSHKPGRRAKRRRNPPPAQRAGWLAAAGVQDWNDLLPALVSALVFTVPAIIASLFGVYDSVGHFLLVFALLSAGGLIANLAIDHPNKLAGDAVRALCGLLAGGAIAALFDADGGGALLTAATGALFAWSLPYLPKGMS